MLVMCVLSGGVDGSVSSVTAPRQAEQRAPVDSAATSTTPGFEAIWAQKFSDASVRERTGRGWDEWIALRERLTTLKQLLES
jgi:hypothetical protein